LADALGCGGNNARRCDSDRQRQGEFGAHPLRRRRREVHARREHRVPGDEVDGHGAAFQEVRELGCVARCVVDAREQHVLDKHLALRYRLVLVDGGHDGVELVRARRGHDRGTQRLARRVQREREGRAREVVAKLRDARRDADGRERHVARRERPEARVGHHRERALHRAARASGAAAQLTCRRAALPRTIDCSAGLSSG
jgi:hypothetical protein